MGLLAFWEGKVRWKGWGWDVSMCAGGWAYTIRGAESWMGWKRIGWASGKLVGWLVEIERGGVEYKRKE